MKVLITGSSGFIGSALMNSLLDGGIIVRGIDIHAPFYPEHKKYWVNADILRLSELKEAFAEFGPTHVIHLAARTDLGLNDTLENFCENIDGVKNVMKTCKMTPTLKTAMFASTILVCKAGYVPTSVDDYCPNTPYGQSKVMGEQILRQSAGDAKFSCCIVRPTSIWGPGFGSHYLDFFRLIAKGKYFHPGRINNRVTYGYIGNCVYQIEKIIKAAPERTNERLFYLGDYSPVELKKWVEMICLELGRPAAKTMPDFTVLIAARFGDLLFRLGWKSVPMTSFRLANMSKDRLYDTSLTQSIVGSLPFTIEQGVRETLKWLRERNEI